MKLNYLCNARIAAILVTQFWVAVASSLGQASPPQAAFHFANASGLPDKILFTIDGTKLRPDGFASGESTGAIGILSGSHRVIASGGSLKPAEASVMMQPNSATTLIAYSKWVLDPITRKPVPQLQIFPQSNAPRNKGKHFYYLYVSARPTAEITVNGQPMSLSALRSVAADEISRGAAKIESGGISIVDFTAAESGSFLVIIFDKPDGSLNGIVLPDYG